MQNKHTQTYHSATQTLIYDFDNRLSAMLLLLFLFILLTLIEASAVINKLNFASFGDFVKSSATRFVFVEFCVPSTTLCQSSMPEFRAITESIHLPMNVRLAT
jgi:hypothetical protein